MFKLKGGKCYNVEHTPLGKLVSVKLCDSVGNNCQLHCTKYMEALVFKFECLM